MCGIAGVYLKKGPVSDDTRQTLLKALHHRGPDGKGTFHEGSVALLHTRLSIVDLETGGQPLHNQDAVLVGNGEIYNHQDIRAQYPDYPWKTQSDFEALLPLIADKGNNFSSSLQGMFALAHFDKKTQKLIISRDIFGIKPLYYCETPQGFYFSSEIKGLLQLHLFTHIHQEKAAELFHQQFTTGNETLCAPIKRLSPGETLVIDKGEVVARTHTSFYDLPPAPRPKNPKQSLEDFESLTLETVKNHLMSDVPVGLFFSGGLDSTLLLWALKKWTDIRTYTIYFPEDSSSEEKDHAENITNQMGIPHTAVSFDERDFWYYLPEVIQAFDDPVMDYAIFPTYKLAHVAQKDVKVILSGEGGDEMFGGYGRYRKFLRPWWLGGDRYFRQRSSLNMKGLFKAPSDGGRSHRELQKGFSQKGFSRLNQARYMDMTYWLPNDLLTKLDRCLMAHGIEGRPPFVDKAIFQFAASLPRKELIHKSYGKWIMRKWLEKRMPEAQPFARKKGFSVPVHIWIAKRSQEVKAYCLQQPGIKDLFEVPVLEKIPVSQHKDLWWKLLYYGIWHDIHIQKRPMENIRTLFS